MATDAYTTAGTDAYTGTGASGSGTSALDFSKAAYDRLAYFALRPELYFDAAADVQPTAQSMPGASVTFTIVNDLPISTSALSESQDVNTVALSDSQVTLTLAEYGNAVLTTAKLRGTSFVDIDPVVANVVGYNAGVSIDTIARKALDSGTNVMYGSGLGASSIQSSITARGSVATSSTLGSVDIRAARARLRSQNVPTFGGMYVGYVHPDTVADIQGETFSGLNNMGWRAPHTYSQPGEIWTGEMGAFEGVRWIETPRAPIYAGAGAASAQSAFSGTITVGSFSGTFTGAAPTIGATLTAGTATLGTGTNTVTYVDGNTFTFSNSSSNAPTVGGTVTASASLTGVNVYGTLILGRQALAKAYSMVDGNGAYPHVVPGPITDRLRRYVPLGWYWLGAYAIFRQASVLRLEHSTTLGGDIDSQYNPAIDLGESGSPLA